MELFWLFIGVLVGIGADELWGRLKRKIEIRNRANQAKKFREENDPAKHSHNLVDIYVGDGLQDSLYSAVTVNSPGLVPVVPTRSTEWIGRVHASQDAPFDVVDIHREVYPHDPALIKRLKNEGVKLWDGSLLYSKNQGDLGSTLPVGVCNYFAYVDLGDRILHESNGTTKNRPLLKHLSSFEESLSGKLAPIVVAASTTCVFETGRGRVVALQNRSQQVVNARGLTGVAPIFGFELNEIAGERSEFGIVVYNVMKELLEEFVNQTEARHVGDKPRVANPDAQFETRHGKLLVAELRSDRLKIFCTGAAVDPSDGSLIFSLLAHFSDPAYGRVLRDATIGSWESEGANGSPKIVFKPLFSPEVDALMSIDKMIPSSIYSLDRARATIREWDRSA